MIENVSTEYLVKVDALKELLLARATGREADEGVYSSLRRELMGIPVIRGALPGFVLDCSTIREFWNFIQPMFETNKYQQRTNFLQREFRPILKALEEGGPLPAFSRGRYAAAATETKARPDEGPDRCQIIFWTKARAICTDDLIHLVGASRIALQLVCSWFALAETQGCSYRAKQSIRQAIDCTNVLHGLLQTNLLGHKPLCRPRDGMPGN